MTKFIDAFIVGFVVGEDEIRGKIEHYRAEVAIMKEAIAVRRYKNEDRMQLLQTLLDDSPAYARRPLPELVAFLKHLRARYACSMQHAVRPAWLFPLRFLLSLPSCRPSSPSDPYPLVLTGLYGSLDAERTDLM